MIFKLPYMYLVQNNVYRVNHDNSPPPGEILIDKKKGGLIPLQVTFPKNLPETAQKS